MNRTELQQNVDTIVIVMMENRSFDNVLGHLRHPDYGNRAEVDGIEALDNPAYLNPNADAVGIPPFWMPDAVLPSDLPHDRNGVATQLAYASIAGAYMMNGFVKAFEDELHSSIDDPPTMGLLRPKDLPTTGALAEQYTVCDRWFACVPTSTAPNRLMSMCGATEIDETGIVLPDEPTVYDWLSHHGVRWRVYSGGLPFMALMPRLATLLLTSHFRRLDALANDLASDPPDLRPQVIFVEPEYHDSPIHFIPPCDNHPPLAMAPGEALLKQVYDALTRDAAQWARTVLIVTYDEHGGFFDHVAPLPVKYRNPKGISFDTTGPRVPTIVAGPFAPRQCAHAQLDNTSILQLLAERFGAPGERYSSEVAGRMLQGIASVSDILSATAANTTVAELAPVGATPAPAAEPPSHKGLRAGFLAAANNLVTQHQAEALAKYPELAELP